MNSPTAGDLHVLAVIDSLAQGGAERSLLDTATRVHDDGITVTIATLHDESEGFPPGDVERLRIGARTPIERIRRLRALIRSGRFDLVHTTLIVSGITGRLAAWGTGVPVLSSIVNTTYDPARLADPNLTGWKVEWIRRIDGWTARHLTTQLHAITGAVRDSAVRSLGVRPTRIVVIPRGRDPERFAPPTPEVRSAFRRDLSLDPSAPVFLTVGRLEYQKGHATLLEAWPAVRAAIPDAMLLLAGRPGNESEHLATMAEELNIGDSVRFLGFRTDVPDLLGVADVFVFPSRYEGLGGALLEAMAAQVPIVVSDLPVTREVLGSAAWFTEPGDASGLAEAMVSAAEAPNHEREAAAAQRFDERFTLDAVATQMAALYRETARAR